MTKCVFCGSEESPFKGVHLIGNDGSTNFYCSSKCRKNALKLRREKKKIRWTEAYRINQQKTADKAVRETAKAESKKEESAKKQNPKKS